MKFGLLVLAYAVLMGVFMYCMRQTIIVMSRLIEYDMRKEIFQQYLKLDRSFFKRNKTGDVMSRITEDVNKVRMYLGPALLYGINLVSLFVIVIITMFKVNYWLSIYTLLPLPVLSVIIYWVSDAIHKKSEKIQKQLAKLTNVVQESMSGIRIIKSYGNEKQWARYFEQETMEYSKLNMDLARVDALFFPSMFLLVGLSTLITIFVGGLNVQNGSVTAGNIAEFVIYVNMLTWPVSAIGWCASIMQQAEASQKRINEFLHTQPELASGNLKASNIKGELRFQDVCFRYPESGILALNKLSFTIHPGEKIAVVGKTASGKTTIAELILRMYDPTDGRIFLDKQLLSDFDISSLRKQMAYVPQDVFLFSDSIANNIGIGLDRTSKEKLDLALKHSGLLSEVEQMPQGQETIIGERGVSLSGGQKQRLAIARAIVEPKPLMILDDCLSAVDAHTEELILNHLFSACWESTLIFITQRLKLTERMDRILVLDQGRLIEQGHFKDLMERNGLFSRLLEIELKAEENQLAK